MRALDHIASNKTPGSELDRSEGVRHKAVECNVININFARAAQA
jgi:hypothetical protein